jgi:hypothetical protein
LTSSLTAKRQYIAAQDDVHPQLDPLMLRAAFREDICFGMQSFLHPILFLGSLIFL